MERIMFLGYVVSLKKIEMDEVKIKAIQEWPTPKMISEVRSFHSLASSYRRFIKDFSTLTAPLTEIVKKTIGFKWDDDQENVFNLLKERLILASLFALPDFTKKKKKLRLSVMSQVYVLEHFCCGCIVLKVCSS
jgi:hypothetical protein